MLQSTIESLEYVWNRVNSYTPVFMVFLLALVYLCIAEDNWVKRYLIYPIIIELLILLNPMISWIIVEKLGYNTRVHRFFWGIPVAFLFAYVCIRIMKQYKSSFFLMFLILFLWVIQGRGFYEDEHYRTENIYKIENKVIEISHAMREISDMGRKIIYVNEIHPNYTLRQYDPSLALIDYPRNLDETMSGDDLYYLGESEEEPSKYTISSYFYKHCQVEEERLYAALQNTEIDYLLLDYEESSLQKKGWIVLEKVTENYYIYKVLI